MKVNFIPWLKNRHPDVWAQEGTEIERRRDDWVRERERAEKTARKNETTSE